MSNSIIGDGGGLRIDRINDGGTLWITDNQIEHNSATGTGGGIAIDSDIEEARAYIERNSIQYNQAKQGGGCYNSSSNFADDGAQVWFKHNQINHNTATDSFGGCHFEKIEGGATVTFLGNEFNHNSAGGNYGGLYLDETSDGAMTFFEDNQIIGNQAGISGTTIMGGNYGGLTLNDIMVGAEVQMHRNTIKSNIAYHTSITSGNYGGLYAHLTSTTGLLNMSDNLIVHNTAQADYGGVAIELESSSRLIMERNLITGNTAITQYGGLAIFGGVDADDSQYFLNWNQIVDNSAIRHGGLSIINADLAEPLWGQSRNNLIAGNTDTGLFIENASFHSINDTIADNDLVGLAMNGTLKATAYISNGIIWGHSTTGFTTTAPVSHTLQADYSDIQGGVLPGLGNISSDPLFVDASRRNYRLQAGSPAIDTGDNAMASAHDLDTVPRPVNTTVDMGAYEYHLQGVMIAPSGLLSGNPGNTVNHTITISNTGNVEDVFTMMLGGSHWDSTLSANSLTVPANSSTTLNLAVMVPTDADAGESDNLAVYATSQRNPQIVDANTIETVANQIAAASLLPNHQNVGQANTTQRYQHVVSNLGNGSDTFTLNAVSAMGWPVQIIPSNLTLAASGSTTIAVQILVPAGLNNVTDHITVTATSAHNSNVTASAIDTITAINIADLALSPQNTEMSVSGRTQVYTHTLTNNASITDALTLVASSSQGWGVIVTPASVNLAAGDSTIVSVNVTIPVGASAGIIDLTSVTATSGNDATMQVTAENVTTIHLRDADLSLAPNNTTTALVNTIQIYSHSLTNNATEADTVSLNATSDQGWAIAITPTSITLGSGVSANVVVNVTVPSGNNGTVDITTLQATSSNNGESIVAVDVTTLLNPASLRVSPGQVGSSLAGTLAAYTYIITNNGARIDTLALNAISDQGWLTQVELVSRRSATPQVRTSRAAQAEVTLLPGESATVAVRVNIPANAPAGQIDQTTLQVVSAYGQAAQTSNTSVTTVRDGQAGATIYLPTIYKNFQGIPDLVVKDLIVTTDGVQVVIQNQGDGDVKDAFWVDLYINPNPVPTGVNDMWYDGRSNEGIVWGLVDSQLVPLIPGGSVILTIGDASYTPALTAFDGFEPGDQIYVQVDSVNSGTTYGAVLENHEIHGQPYNNLAGPFVATFLSHSGGIRVDQTEAPSVSSDILPARPKLIQ